MTAITAGRGRFVKRNSAGNIVTGTESREYRLADLDNTSAPRIVLNDRQAATPDDLLSAYRVKFDGRQDEVLEVQANLDAADTFDTADSTALLLNITEFLKIDGKWIPTNKNLRISHRLTPAGGSGIIDARGLDDDQPFAANVWAPYARFAPGSNAIWILTGHQIVDVHDDTA